MNNQQEYVGDGENGHYCDQFKCHYQHYITIKKEIKCKFNNCRYGTTKCLFTHGDESWDKNGHCCIPCNKNNNNKDSNNTNNINNNNNNNNNNNGNCSKNNNINNDNIIMNNINNDYNYKYYSQHNPKNNKYL